MSNKFYKSKWEITQGLNEVKIVQFQKHETLGNAQPTQRFVCFLSCSLSLITLSDSWFKVSSGPDSGFVQDRDKTVIDFNSLGMGMLFGIGGTLQFDLDGMTCSCIPPGTEQG